MRKIFLLLSALFLSLSTGFGQDRIYWGDQNGPSNIDKIGSVKAADLTSETTVYSDFALNPNGIAYYQANPTYPLFYATTGIYRNDLAGTSNEFIVPTGQFNRGVAIDYTGKKIYWANSGEGYIGRADLDGSNKDETFITGLSNPWDVEIDPVNGKIYWSETDYPGTNAFIQRANLSDGTGLETLVSNVNSQGIAVDPLRGKIYYTVFTTGANVYSANLDGSGGAGPITGLSAIADIDVDVATGTLYMIDYSSNLLTKANPDGSGKSSITAGGVFLAYGDVTAPTIPSILRKNPSADVGEGGTATFRVTFSEPVLNLDATDFELSGTPAGTITVSPVNLHTVFDVIVSDISGTGTLDLNVAAAQDLVDFRGNAFTGTIANEETYSVISVAAPAVTSFDPTFGAEGTTVVITGTGFSTTPAENTVAFNGVEATVTASSATSITTTVPAGAATGPISVTVYGLNTQSAGDFTVCTPPPVPAIAREGNVLTSSADTGNQWLKNGSEVAGATDKSFTAVDPGDYTVRVTGDVCSSVSTAVTITEAELTPQISGFDPGSGEAGSTVVISGTNFSATPGSNTVAFGALAATVTASTLTTITVLVPSAAPVGPAAITVTVNGRMATAATNFTVLCTPPAKPTITTEGGLLISSSNSNNQWLRNGVEIPGAVNKGYTATEAGSYTVRVTENACSAESDPTMIVGTEEALSSGVSIFPNPSASVINIEFPSKGGPARAELYSLAGVKKLSAVLPSENGTCRAQLNVKGYADGIYVMYITTGTAVMVRKVYLKPAD